MILGSPWKFKSESQSVRRVYKGYSLSNWLAYAHGLSLMVKVLEIKPYGRVDQFGMIATLASWRPRVQIPPRPPNPLPVRFTPSSMLYFLKFPHRK